MAENVVGELLGGGEDEAVEAAESGLGAGGRELAAGMAMDLASRHPLVARRAAEFLAQQTRLLQLQATWSAAEHPLRIAHLHSQSREGKLRRTGQRIRIGLQLITALVVGAVGLGFAVMIYDAFTSRTVVVEAFKAPAALAGGGLTGDVVAADVLDELQRLEDATRAADKLLSTRSAWSSDVKIEVPETGVSLGEINRLLHQRFGHDIHIDGDLVQTGTGGLSLTVRGDGVPAATFEGGSGDIHKLAVEAAEYLYGRSQPRQFAIYLVDKARYKDALGFLPDAFLRASDAERPDLANTWGNTYASLNDGLRAAEKYRLAISLKPRFWKAWGNLVGAISSASGEEAGWRAAQAMFRAAQAAPARDRPNPMYLVNPAQMTQDWQTQLAGSLFDAAKNRGAGSGAVIEGPSIAEDYAHLHDPANAAKYMALSDPDDSLTKAEALLLAGYAALDRGDARAALPPLDSFWKAWLADPNLQYVYNDQQCLAGFVYVLSGRMAEADTVFGNRNSTFARCYALHGEALERTGDLAGAERVWAEGLRIGPDLSPVYLARGLSELRRGDLKRAEADLAAASRRSPHWADPIKTWGDVLAREGRWSDAQARYREAARYAPAWTGLHEALATAEAQVRRRS